MIVNPGAPAPRLISSHPLMSPSNTNARSHSYYSAHAANFRTQTNSSQCKTGSGMFAHTVRRRKRSTKNSMVFLSSRVQRDCSVNLTPVVKSSTTRTHHATCISSLLASHQLKNWEPTRTHMCTSSSSWLRSPRSPSFIVFQSGGEGCSHRYPSNLLPSFTPFSSHAFFALGVCHTKHGVDVVSCTASSWIAPTIATHAPSDSTMLPKVDRARALTSPVSTLHLVLRSLLPHQFQFLACHWFGFKLRVWCSCCVLLL